MPFRWLLVSFVILFVAAPVARMDGVAHAADDRRVDRRKNDAWSIQRPGRAPDRDRQASPNGRRDGQHGQHNKKLLAPNERRDLRQSVYEATRDIYKGG